MASEPCVTPERRAEAPLHPKEQALLTLIRTMGYGTLYRIVVQDGLPQLVEEKSHNIRL